MKFALWTILFLNLSACAYSMGPHQRQLPGNKQKIFVKMFENRTQEVGIEADLTNAFIMELTRAGVGEVTSQNDAEVILEGVIHTVDYLGKSAITMDGNRSMFTEYQTRVNIVLRAIDKQKSSELWQGQFMGEKNYKAPQLTTYGLRTSNPIYNQSARRQTIKAIGKEMATEAVSRMTENF